MRKEIILTIILAIIAVFAISTTAKLSSIDQTTTIHYANHEEEIDNTETSQGSSYYTFNLLSPTNKTRVSSSRRSSNGGNAPRCCNNETISQYIIPHHSHCTNKTSAMAQANQRYYIYLRNLRI